MKPRTSGGLAFLLLSLPLISCSNTNGPATATLTIQGTVNEADIGGPIGGALVQIQIVTTSGPGDWASDSTATDGSYVIKAAVPGGCEGRDSVDAVLHAEAVGFDSLREGATAGALKVACRVEPQTLDVTLELPISRTPVAVAGNLTATDVSGGAMSACATTNAGAYCWGRNKLGVSAVGSPDDGTDVLKVPTPVVNGSGLVQVDANYLVACGLDAGGVAYCWGDNEWGQLGVSDTTVIEADQAMAVKTDLRFTQITAGARAPCGLTAQGTVYCWGSAASIGVGAIDADAYAPEQPIASDRTFVQVSGGQAHACALDDTGAAWCWGRNRDGEVGNGATGESWVASPEQVVGGHTFVQIAAGGFHVCGLTASGEAWCWGLNDDGQLGTGQDTGNSGEPVAVAGGHAFTSLSGGYVHTCGLTADGTAYCWGGDYAGALGVETTEACTGPIALADRCARQPEPVSGGLKFSKLGAGWGVTCGMTSAGKLYCWGLKQALGTG